MRLGECLGLRMDCVTPTHLVVKQQAQKLGGRLEIRPPKTKSSVRTIPIPEGFYAQLLATRSHEGIYLCSNTNGDVLDPENASRAMAAAATRSGLTTATFHHLRSSFSSNMDEAGCPVRAKKEIMGHVAGNVSEGYSRAYDQTKTRFLGILLEAMDEADRLLVVRPLGGRKKVMEHFEEGTN